MTHDQANSLIRQYLRPADAKAVSGFLLPSVGITPTPASTNPAASRFGGLPALPPNTPWPRWDPRPPIRRMIQFLEKKVEGAPQAIGLIEILGHYKKSLAVESAPNVLPRPDQLRRTRGS